MAENSIGCEHKGRLSIWCTVFLKGLWILRSIQGRGWDRSYLEKKRREEKRKRVPGEEQYWRRNQYEGQQKVDFLSRENSELQKMSHLYPGFLKEYYVSTIWYVDAGREQGTKEEIHLNFISKVNRNMVSQHIEDELDWGVLSCILIPL